MAEALVSLALEQLVSILRTQTEAGVRLDAALDGEVQTLTSNFQAIQDVLEDAERRQVNEKAVRRWLDLLKHASYDISDVLDEWNTEIQKLQLKKLENGLDTKVRSLAPSCCFSPWQIIRRHEVATKIKNLNKTLDDIAKEKERYNFSLMRGTGEPVRPVTTSFSDEPKMYGRDPEKSAVINFLLSESSQGPLLPIVSIVGMGGLGKTTLARLVFNDDEVISHFDVKTWVCVSNPFDEIRIAEAIFESLNCDAKKPDELETLLQYIHQSIKGKKLLLVLDDVWTEDPENWKQLKGSLKCASRGSRILVTTRKESTSIVMGTSNTISLEMLSDQDSWLLFSQVALSSRTNEERENLKDIGLKIVHKCKGLPLAVKTLGSLLSMKTNIAQWKSVLDSELWKLEDVEKGLFPPLLLSYYDLPFQLRKCFSYCAIFPKGYKIDKDELIKLWMAQDYLRVEGREDHMELIGEEYFENLAMRSFFQDFERSKYDRSITRCKMHDIVHDCAQFLTNNEYSTIDINNLAKSKLESFCKEARHLRIRRDWRSSIPVTIYSMKRLHSLVLESSYGPFSSTLLLELLYSSPRKFVNLSKLFKQVTCLRTLDLRKCSLQKVPREIKYLIHLRYLNLSCNGGLQKLPKSLCDLYNLQTLDLTECNRLQKLPQGMEKLINLRHLINCGNRQLYYMPREIERMTHLRMLGTLVVGGNEACSLELLKNLNHQRSFELQGLGNLCEVDSAEALKSMQNLIDLKLTFWKVKRKGVVERNAVVLEVLEPPPNLQKISIEQYEGKTIFPHWMVSLTYLRVLTLIACKNCEYLPPLGKLPSLESLSLCYMDRVRKVGNEFLGIESCGTGIASGTSITVFPKLKTLEFYSMNEWEEWNITWGDDIIIMPSLHCLTVKTCLKLKALPDHVLQTSTLQELQIPGCPILKERYKREIGKDWPKISHIPYIRFNHQYQQVTFSSPDVCTVEMREVGEIRAEFTRPRFHVENKRE